jgi:hypothetical protein
MMLFVIKRKENLMMLLARFALLNDYHHQYIVSVCWLQFLSFFRNTAVACLLD